MLGRRRWQFANRPLQFKGKIVTAQQLTPLSPLFQEREHPKGEVCCHRDLSSYEKSNFPQTIST
jgi:hypothetical protein